MSLKETFSNFFMLDDEEGSQDQAVKQKEPRLATGQSRQPGGASSTPQEEDKSGGLSLVSMNKNQSQKLRIKVVEPRLYSEVKEIADLVLTNQSVILNFRRMDKDQAKKVIDFMMGVTYAIGGDIQRVGDQIFLATPANIEIDANDISGLDREE